MKKKNRIWIYLLIVMGFVLIHINSCKKEENKQIPTIVTASITNITDTSATCGGNVTNDGGATVTVKGVCWGTKQFYTISDSTDSKTNDGTGIGSFTSAITGLSPKTTYYVRAYATNSVGTSYGSVVSFKTKLKEIVYGSIICDIDGNTYKTVVIGTQTWMAENLKTTKYNDGTAIPLVTDKTEWNNLTTPGYCWYNNDEATNKATYGALYNWYTVNTGKLCPTGWHVPTQAEWTTLTDYLGGEGIAGGKLKETGSTHWDSPNTGATNETGFTALPGGFRTLGDGFIAIGFSGCWWTSTMTGSFNVWYRYMFNDISDVYYGGLAKGNGLSIRCLMD
jgi:uncharacterized protein (TIGR02145 family)